MKIRDITFGSIMIALFVVLGLVFSTDVRAIQVYLEAAKTVVVSIYIRLSPRKSRIMFIPACLGVCFLLLPMHITLIYNVPALVCGFVLGIQKGTNMKALNYFVFFCANTIMLLYEFWLYYMIMHTDLLQIYKEEVSIMLNSISSINISSGLMQIVFVLLMLADSAFSSFVVYIISCLTFKRLSNLISTREQNKVLNS